MNRLKWLYPLLFTIYVFSITLFTHTHYINNIQYVHSHPFKFGEPPTHEHTDIELQLLDQIFNTSITSDILPVINLTGNALLQKIDYTKFHQGQHIIYPPTSLQLRAPPLFF